MTEIPNVQPYNGDMPDRQTQDRDTFASNIYLYITWAGTTFLTAFNLAVEKFNLLADEVNIVAEEVQTNKDYVSSAQATVEATMGATYGGTWNESGDFTSKTTAHNGIIWVGLAPIIGEAPAYNSKWLFVSFIKNIVEVNTDYTASVGDEIRIDSTSNVVNITFPSPTKDAVIEIVDIELMFSTNKVNLTFPSATFYREDEVIELKDNTSSFRFVCRELSSGDYDWRIL